MINIKGIDKARLLVELYNHSHQQGLGMLQPAKVLTIEEAKKLLEETTYFDYLYGKVMKVDLSSDEQFEERLYDLDNGKGTAEAVVNELRKLELSDASENEKDGDTLTNEIKNNNSLKDFDSIFAILNEISNDLKIYCKNILPNGINSTNSITKEDIITKFEEVIQNADALNKEMGAYEFKHFIGTLNSYYASFITGKMSNDILIQSYDSFIKECLEDKNIRKVDKDYVEKKYEGTYKAINYMNYLNSGNHRNGDMEKELEKFGYIINPTTNAIQSKDYHPIENKRFHNVVYTRPNVLQGIDENEQDITSENSVRDVRSLQHQKMILKSKLEEKVRKTGELTDKEKEMYNKLNSELKSLADGKKSVIKFIYYCYKMNNTIKKGYKICDNKNHKIVNEQKGRNK